MTVSKALRRLLGWCPETPRRHVMVPPLHLVKTPGLFFCSSAFLLALGAYVSTLEALVWVGNEYEPMHICLPVGLLLGLLALILLVYGTILGMRSLPASPLKTVSSWVALVASLTFGALALVSIALPWVVAERAIPVVGRAGVIDVGRYHTLTWIQVLTGSNGVHQVLLVPVGAVIAILHVPLLTLLERKRTHSIRASLFLVGGLCIVRPVALVCSQRSWWINLRVDDGAVGFAATSETPALGLLVATVSAIGLTAFGLTGIIKPARARLHRAVYDS